MDRTWFISVLEPFLFEPWLAKAATVSKTWNKILRGGVDWSKDQHKIVLSDSNFDMSVTTIYAPDKHGDTFYMRFADVPIGLGQHGNMGLHIGDWPIDYAWLSRILDVLQTCQRIFIKYIVRPDIEWDVSIFIRYESTFILTLWDNDAVCSETVLIDTTTRDSNVVSHYFWRSSPKILTDAELTVFLTSLICSSSLSVQALIDNLQYVISSRPSLPPPTTAFLSQTTTSSLLQSSSST